MEIIHVNTMATKPIYSFDDEQVNLGEFCCFCLFEEECFFFRRRRITSFTTSTRLIVTVFTSISIRSWPKTRYSIDFNNFLFVILIHRAIILTTIIIIIDITFFFSGFLVYFLEVALIIITNKKNKDMSS